MHLQLPRDRARRYGLLGLVLVYLAAGLNHFLSTGVYLPMMPSWIPAHRELIYLSGALEILGGLAVLVPRFRPAAGWFLVALLIAVFPANVHMARNPELFAPAPAWALFLRLPMQIALGWWAWWATRPESSDRS